ncbi:unnamed protein product [Urochloa decumbens]|uniref:Subtilisin-like protease n=1 Tax=Urochloa decumbens TaxID=240449 RepID=A0ABC8XG33_9POAL
MLNCAVNLIVVIFLAAYGFLLPLSADEDQTKEPYIVYMGSTSKEEGGGGGPETLHAAHMQMLSSIIPGDEQERASLMHSYHHAFEGFAAILTEEEAAALSGHERVVSVFRDPALQLHTTRSWDFLEAQSGLRPDWLSRRASSDVIIGVVDTGVWPESPSFKDDGMPEVPARWRGEAHRRPVLRQQHSAGVKRLTRTRLATGHRRPRHAHRIDGGRGGRGLPRGTAKGGAPRSRVAVYQACSREGCSGSAVLKAIDDAVRDGVDVISISVGIGSGSGSQQQEFLDDPIALGAFHAHQRGVLVVCSAGNDGPDAYTVVNTAPWILTVGASSIDRAFQSSIALGNGNVVKESDGRDPPERGRHGVQACTGRGILLVSRPRQPHRVHPQGRGDPVATSSGTGAAATGHDMGAGDISPLRALSPGLVFDTATRDYLNFLCYYGYSEKVVRKVSGAARFACPAAAAAPGDDPIAAGVNYPSISVARIHAGGVLTVARTVTNVGSSNVTYAAAVEAPPGLTVRVAPERLAFSRRGATARFEVSFHGSAATRKGYAHGAVTWTDGAHTVRVPFAVNVV